MATKASKRVGHIEREHEWLLERLRSLDNCLDNILYFGEACADLRGFGGLRLRCLELQQALREHIPEEEQVFAGLEGRGASESLLTLLRAEHRTLARDLEGALETLDALLDGALLPEDLFRLQDRVRGLSATLQRHIRTENEQILPLVAAACLP
ncbi:MAG: hemerythrin domain-containing protein [Acidobacteria bacterium]|nr:hemerythrin domain-containing protein [Acidobacteriota bacterium]